MWTDQIRHRLRTGDAFPTEDRAPAAPRWRTPSPGPRILRRMR